MVNLHASIIFVFDGDQCPKVKRGKTQSKTLHWLEELFLSLIQHFGFQSYKVNFVLSLSLVSAKIQMTIITSIGPRGS